MKNITKGNIISAVIGIVVGVSITIGIQSLLNKDEKISIQNSTNKNKITNFDIVKYDSNGNVYITTSGKKYHNSWCYIIKDKDCQQVNSFDAERKGFSPCKKCH